MEKLLAKVLSGHADASIRFTELCTLLQRLGFTMRVHGSHHIFNRFGASGPINIQSASGLAKEYQVRQIRRILIQNGWTTITGARNGH